MENVVIDGKAVTVFEEKVKDPVWRRVLRNVVAFFEVNAQSKWEKMYSSKWNTRWWYWQ